MKKIFLVTAIGFLTFLPHLVSAQRQVPAVGTTGTTNAQKVPTIGITDARKIAAVTKFTQLKDVTKVANGVRSEGLSLLSALQNVARRDGAAKACALSRQLVKNFPQTIDSSKDALATKFGISAEAVSSGFFASAVVAKIAEEANCSELNCWLDVMNDVIFVDGFPDDGCSGWESCDSEGCCGCYCHILACTCL